MCVVLVFFFFFKQKTAYEIGTGDWSSDVCSSDLLDGQECNLPSCLLQLHSISVFNFKVIANVDFCGIHNLQITHSWRLSMRWRVCSLMDTSRR